MLSDHSFILLYMIITLSFVWAVLLVIGLCRMMSMTEQERRLLENISSNGNKDNDHSGDELKNKQKKSGIFNTAPGSQQTFINCNKVLAFGNLKQKTGDTHQQELMKLKTK